MLKKLLILSLTSILLCGCGKNNQEEIIFSSWGSITEVQILNRAISEFEAKNPEIKVNFLHIPQNYFQKLHLLFASSQAPDVIFINNLYLPIYAEKLADLSKIVNKDEYFPESLKSMSYDGKLLAIPRDVSNLVFYRNKELISETPKNLDEFLKTISKSPKFGVSFEPDVYYMFPYVLSFDEYIMQPKDSLIFYKNLEGKYAPTRAQTGSLTQAQMFLDGKIGLYLSGRWMYPKISENAKFEWDVITFPGVVPMDSSGWAIAKDSKHKDSAEKFVKFLASDETSKYFLESGLVVPAKIDIAKDIDNKVFLEAINKSSAQYICRDYKKAVDKMNKDFFD